MLDANPEQRRELVQQPALIPNAIEEMLRWEAPSPVQARYVSREVQQNGQTIAEGSGMLLLNGAANRDERRFLEHDRFDIHRDVLRHLSFGYGIHFCLGAALAGSRAGWRWKRFSSASPNGRSKKGRPFKPALLRSAAGDPFK